MRTRSKGLTGLIAVAAASLLTLTACVAGVTATRRRRRRPPVSPTVRPSPNTCNSGNTEPGGDIHLRPREDVHRTGTSRTERATRYETGQVLTGVLPRPSCQPERQLQLNADLMASAEHHEPEPVDRVYKIKPDAVWSDGTPISADDFILRWK